MATKVKLGATDISGHVRDRSVSWGPRDLATRVDIARFGIRGSSPVIPDDDLYVEITDPDGLAKVFAGIARQPDAEESVADGGTELVYQVAAQGWGALLYRIPITATESYAAGLSDRYIVSDLLTKYYGPIGTGITHVLYTSRSDMPAMTFTEDQLSLGQALDQIATEANGAPWWIDPDKAVHWNDTRRRAPFIISTAPDAVTRDSFRRTLLALAPTFHLRLAERSGTSSADASGNGNTATWNAQPTLRRDGAVDDECFAILKTADAEHASLGDICDFAGTAAFSVGLWYKPSALTAGRFMSKEITDGSGRQGWLLYFNGSGAFGLERWLNGAQDNAYCTNGSIVADQWYFLVGTYDGTSIRVYLNGALAGGPNASSKVVVNHANPIRIGAHSAGHASGAGPRGDWAEPFAISGALSATQVAALYAARMKRKVGTRHITQLADSTQQAHRIQVVGANSGATYEATDWTEWARLQKRRADEPGSPSTRILTLPTVVDDELTTLAETQRRAFSILANQARRRPYMATVHEPGLEPGQRVDVISSKFGTRATGQPTLDEALTVRETPSLSDGMGRFIVQRVEPALIGDDKWAYKVTFGDFQPTLPIVLAKATGRQSVTRTNVAPKTLTSSEMANRLRRIPVPIFGATVRTGSPAVGIYGANTRYRAWAFDPSALEEIVVECVLPKDAMLTPRIDERFSGKPNGVYLQPIITLVALGANTGNVTVRVTASSYTTQGSADFNSTGFEAVIEETHLIPGPAHNMIRRPLVSDGIPITPQGPADRPDVVVRLVIGRVGNGGFDTLADDVGLFAVELEYLADS